MVGFEIESVDGGQFEKSSDDYEFVGRTGM